MISLKKLTNSRIIPNGILFQKKYFLPPEVFSSAFWENFSLFLDAYDLHLKLTA